jgi:hypothetical protein
MSNLTDNSMDHLLYLPKTILNALLVTATTSQEGIVDLQKFIFDAQYVLYPQNSIFYITTIYCFAIQFS